MNTNDKDDDINVILKDAHSEIQPQDSWEALKSRIDEKVFNGEKPSVIATRLSKNAAFWRRIALALAACLVITTGLFVYVLNDSPGDSQGQMNLADEGLLSRKQLDQLGVAFSHVRELFGSTCPWMVIDSGGEGQIGVNNRAREAIDWSKIIIIRLAVNVEGQEIQRRYFDVVTFSNQQVSFNFSVAERSDMGVSITPVMTSDGTITLEIKTELESGTQAGDFVTVADDKFTSVIRVKSDGSWLNIDAIGQAISSI